MTVRSHPPRALPQHDDVAVLFVEIAHFASVVASMKPAKCLELLNSVFYEFDWLTTESGLLKVETVGSGEDGVKRTCRALHTMPCFQLPP